jgi:hypothetical protein
LITILLIALLVQPAAERAAPAPSAVIRKFFGAGVIQIVRHPTRVEAFRIKWTDHQDLHGRVAVDRIGGLRIVGESRPVADADAVRVGDLLLSQSTYNKDFPVHMERSHGTWIVKNCAFGPVVAIRFWKGESSATILLCFQCDDLEVVTASNGRERKGSIAWFSGGRSELLRTVRKLFPDDELVRLIEDR